MRFRTTILQTGPNTTGIPVPDDVVEVLGAGRRPPVVVTVGGHTYRSTVATMDGRLLVSLSAANRAAAGVGGGDEVDIDLVLDDEPRQVDVPPELAAGLAADAAASAFFDALSPSRKKAFTTWIDDAKKPATRQARVDASVTMLREGRSR